MQHSYDSTRTAPRRPRAWLAAAAVCTVAGVALAAAAAENPAENATAGVDNAARTRTSPHDAASDARTETDRMRAETELARGSLEAVESFYLAGGPQRWSMVDDDTVIVWATSYRPYLIDLAFRSPDLVFADRIALTSLEHRVYAKFDAVRVAGMRYPIAGIYKITPEEAKAREAS